MMMMKLIHSIFITISMAFCLPILAQTQIGIDIDGETVGEESGAAISLSGDGTRLAVGAPANSETGANKGQARVYEMIGGNWTQIGTDINGASAGDRFGTKVSLSNDGSRLAVSATFNDGNGDASGSVAVYRFVGGDWVQLGTNIYGEASNDLSGWSMTLSDDGTRVAIGAIQNGGSFYNAGHVRVYLWNGSNWVKLGPDIDGEANGDYSGESVSFSGNGNRIAIGAIHNGGNGYNSGHVRVYQKSGNNWLQMGADIEGEGSYDRSGNAVSLSEDGSRLAIGAYANTNPNNGTSGHVRIYEWSNGSWTQLGMDIDGSNGGGYRFGWDVSLSNDGNRVAIGAFLGESDNGDNAGNVQIHDFNNGTWTQVYNNIYGEAAEDYSGQSVSLSADGSRVAIGARNNDGNGNNAGHVRVYELPICASTSGTDEITACESYLWIDGNTYTSSNNSASHVIPNSSGCDSIITLDLTIGSNTSSEIEESVCESFTLNGQTYTSSGTYSQTIPNSLGCDSIITLDLTIQTVNVTVIFIADELFADESDATYQWIDCDTNQPIDGETNQGFMPTVSGNYALEVTKNGCTALSECFNVMLSSVEESNFPTSISVFPNPVQDKTQVELGKVYDELWLEIFDLQGKLISSETILNQESFIIDASEFPSGSYFLSIKSKENKAAIVLLKK